MKPPVVQVDPFSSVHGEVDRLLQGYFQREIPKPWPEWKAPSPANKSPGIFKPWRSRMALAASIALLFLAQLLLFRSYKWEATSTVTDKKPPLDVAEKILPGKGNQAGKKNGESHSGKKESLPPIPRMQNMR
jgi:hypothetical protein